jgi:CheY-like chemotaxis protein
MNLNILLVEDDEIETLKLERAFKKLGFTHNIFTVKNGEEALSFCKLEQPNLILLDINMPKMNGLEFLFLLKKDKNLKFIPTVIFTTSNNHQDLIKAYEIGVAGYIVKPLRYENYVAQIEKLINYWTINEFVTK